MRGVINAIASRISGKYLARIALVCAAQFAAGKVGDALQTVNDGGIGPVWPASGIALAALLLWDYSVWPGVAAGAFLLAFLSPLPHWAAVLYAAGTTLAAALGVFLLRSITKFDNSLSHLRDALGLIILGAFVSSTVSASIGASILFANLRSWSGLGLAGLVYWLGDSTGVLLLTPVTLMFPNILRTRDRKRITELALFLVLLTIGGFIVFGDFPLVRIKLHILTFAVLPFVMWAAIRLGVSATALSIFAIGTVATVETALGSGPFTTNTPIMNAVLLDVFFAVVSITGLILASAIAEREQAERERERLVRERAEAEAQLRFAAIVESSEDAIISGTLDGIIVSWNAGAQRMYGYPEAEVVGKPITILAPPERPDEENRILETLRAGGRIENFETIRVTKAGERISVSLSISPIKDSSGRIVGISGIARDITERKLAEEAMRESEERLRLAAQAGKMYAFEWDVATDVMVRSSEYVNVLGASEPRTLTHQQVLERIHPEDRPKLLEAIARHSLENPTVDVTYRVLLPGKSPIWVKSSGRAFFDGEDRMLRVIGMVADVTDQKLAEEALRSSEERLRLAQKAARMGTFERNIRTGVNTWTPEMESMYGLPPGGFGQTRTAFENLVHPDDRAEVMKLVDEALKTGRPTHGEWRVVWPDESVHWIAGRWQVLMEESGEPSRVVGVDMDITERKRSEEALADVTRKLINAQELERTRIGRELHDDIGQRLAMLAIGLEQLQQESPALPAEVRSQMGELKKQTFEIAADIQSLSHQLHSAKLQYLGIAAAMRGFCQEFGEQQKVEVDFQTHDLPSPVSPDTALCLFRVLQEALHNSAKHSGVRHFEVRLWGTSDEIHLTVRDPGVSFDREAAKQSRGLGLISMEERLKLVNGTLSIESQPRRGTTIHARVPLRSGSDSMRATG
jgi:PAS domain S-box-containing protein